MASYPRGIRIRYKGKTYLSNAEDPDDIQLVKEISRGVADVDTMPYQVEAKDDTWHQFLDEVLGDFLDPVERDDEWEWDEPLPDVA